MSRRSVFEGIAVLGALALLCLALMGLPFIALQGAIAAQAPDPFISDGDPCCGHPDTWGEVASTLAVTLGLVALDGLAIAGAVALFRWSSSRPPRWRQLAWFPLGGLAVSVLVVAVVLVPHVDEARELPDCDSFVFRERDWRSSDDDRHLATAWGIADCDTFAGADRRTVEQRLGKPSSEGSLGAQHYLSYDGVNLILDGDHVVEAVAGHD